MPNKHGSSFHPTLAHYVKYTRNLLAGPAESQQSHEKDDDPYGDEQDSSSLEVGGITDCEIHITVYIPIQIDPDTDTKDGRSTDLTKTKGNNNYREHMD